MGEHLYEMHMHSTGISACSSASVREGCDECKKAGYSGVVLTNHINPWSHSCITEDGLFLPQPYLDEFYRAKENETPNFRVLLGAEVKLNEGWSEFLLYGLTEDILLHGIPENIMTFSQTMLRDLSKELDLLLFQSHPFRSGMSIVPPEWLDGIEIHNGCIRHDSRNDIAQLWAKKFDLLGSSGSDYHHLGDAGTGGIWVDRPISNERDLLAILRSGNYRCMV